MDVEYVASQLEKQLREYIENTNARGVVVGLSGGIDSAVIYNLCINAFKETYHWIYPIYLPDKYSTPENLSLVEDLIHPDTIALHIVDIESIFKAHHEHKLWMKSNPIADANLRSRIRMCELYHIANAYNLLVVGTTNKTEAYLGYYTKYGDGAVDIEPIADLYKHEVYELGKFYRLPEEVLTKPPSAGLWEDQTDEKELGYSYDVLDRVVHFLSNGYKSSEEYTNAILDLSEHKLGPAEVKLVKDLHSGNYHKMKTPPSFKIKRRK